ncbi:MAG: hypothetical protein M0P49_00670 [Bacilli bacterium]|jgi:hypothetical protein|nr:hypothetical protein [Bacilli bacterium]
MEKSNLILVRDKHKALNGTISFIGDNMQLYNENNGTIIWDDVNTNGIVNVIRPSTNYKTNVEKPISLETFEYAQIQYISSTMNIDKLITLLDGFVTDELITTERKDAIIVYFNNIKAGINNPLPGTNA